jgi:ribulose-5-phosphate 4-epimerase/fuculose-1-phosphate aldolase
MEFEMEWPVASTEHTVFPWSGCTAVDDERLHRKQRLAVTFRLFARMGFDEGVAGHISVRDPEHAESFWVNPFGLDFATMRVSDLVRVDADGTVVDGERAVNRSAFAIHGRIHAARPDVVAVAHSHSRHGKAWSALGRRLEPITQDHCDFYDDHVLYDRYDGVVDDVAEGDRIAAALGTAKAAILRNHGLLTVGQSVDEAAWWFVRLERCCEISLLAHAAGTPHVIDEGTARAVHEAQGSPVAGWFTFQPLHDRVVAAEPELLD